MTAVVAVAVTPMWLSCVIGWAVCVVPMLAVEWVMRGAHDRAAAYPADTACTAPTSASPSPRFARGAEVHAATTHNPLCPGCLEDEAREIRDGK